MSHKWNVYKIFHNGKRAKKPILTFDHQETNNIEQYFDEKIKINFSDKLKKSKFVIIRDDLPQERQAEKVDEGKRLYEEKKIAVFKKYFKAANKTKIKGDNTSAGLTLCKESDWKWQWAFLEPGTSRYLAPISNTFSKCSEAELWMSEQIKIL